MSKVEISQEELRKRRLFVGCPAYNSQVEGSFNVSMNQLTALCLQEGIHMQPYYLFSESLISRARNYISDEFMRSDCTHMLFIDSDISFNPHDVIHMLALQGDDTPYDILCGVYPKKCLHNTTKIITEDGIKSINWVVKNKYSGKVKSLDKDGNITWNKILNYWSEPNLGKKWLNLSTVKDRKDFTKAAPSSVICTEDHDIAYIDNILDPDNIKIKWTRADDMLNKWAIFTEKVSSKNSNRDDRVNLFTKEQLSILVGMSLGDSCLKNMKCVTAHSESQYQYNIHKQDIFGGRLHFNKFNQSYLQFSNPQVEAIGDILYNGKQKTIKGLEHLIDASTFAFLYMDDGHRYHYPEAIKPPAYFSWWYKGENTLRSANCPGEGWKQGRKEVTYRPTSSIATFSLSLEDSEYLIKILKEKYDIEGYIFKQKHHTGIKFNNDNTDKFHKLIAPYVPQCMEYKLNLEYRGGVKISIDKEGKKFSCKKITSIEEFKAKNKSNLFDLEIENDNCLFVNNGMLVHNCLSWSKIRDAVKQGYGDDDPRALSEFVGDFVFNPVQGTTINIHEPAEVSESGTGFMMIRRNTFEKFKEAYPQQHYLPDHVYNEHFDGTREIVAYFDCPIDGKLSNLKEELTLYLKRTPNASHADILKFCTDPNWEASRPYSKRYLSEDYMYCAWSRKIGMKVWICPWIRLVHWGKMPFGGSLQALAAIQASPTVDEGMVKKR